MERAKAPRWIAFAVLGLYFWGLTFSGMVLPDLFYAALLSGFLLLVHAKHYAWASAMLFPLMLARESTILILLCWLYVAWHTLGWSKRLISVAATSPGQSRSISSLPAAQAIAKASPPSSISPAKCRGTSPRTSSAWKPGQT